MKIAVLGATGRTGRPLVEELLRRGHEVSVLVRSPAKLGDLAGRLRVVTGSSTERAALDEVLTGADAVISALGPTKDDPTLMSATARPLVEAMAAAGVRRFVGISGAGQDLPGDRKGRKDRIISAIIQRTGGAIVAEQTRRVPDPVRSGDRLDAGPATDAPRRVCDRSLRARRARAGPVQFDQPR